MSYSVKTVVAKTATSSSVKEAVAFTTLVFWPRKTIVMMSLVVASNLSPYLHTADFMVKTSYPAVCPVLSWRVINVHQIQINSSVTSLFKLTVKFFQDVWLESYPTTEMQSSVISSVIKRLTRLLCFRKHNISFRSKERNLTQYSYCRKYSLIVKTHFKRDVANHLKTRCHSPNFCL